MNSRIIEYEAIYRATGNPLYVWEALTYCAPGEPLPGWIFDYLQRCASAPPDEAPDGAVGVEEEDPVVPKPRGLLDVATYVAIDKMTPSAAVNSVARALGLQQGNNFNAFADNREREKNASMASYVQASGRRKAWAKIAEATGLSRSQIHERVKSAERLWQAQDRAKPSK
jgi:hypothetical protein